MRRFALPSSALGAVLAASALLAYAPDLAASQEPALEGKVASLERENRALRRRLDQLDASMLAMAPKTPSPSDQTKKQERRPKTTAEASAAFRAQVRKALSKELAQLEALSEDVASLEKTTKALQSHTHAFSLPGRSPRAFIAKRSWDVISDDAMIPYVPVESVGKPVPDRTFTTSGPQ